MRCKCNALLIVVCLNVLKLISPNLFCFTSLFFNLIHFHFHLFFYFVVSAKWELINTPKRSPHPPDTDITKTPAIIIFTLIII